MTALTPPVVSTLAAGVIVLMQMGLGFAVIAVRRRVRQSLGDGGYAELLQAVRRHGNLAENAALFVVALALLEMMGGGRLLVEILAGVFILARISHAAGLSQRNSVNGLRTIGIAGTLGVGLVLAWHLIARGAVLLRP